MKKELEVKVYGILKQEEDWDTNAKQISKVYLFGMMDMGDKPTSTLI